METVKLILIDEIHVLGESSRGAVIEAVVSRMKAYTNNNNNNIDTEMNYDTQESHASDGESRIRFIAVSANIPNIEDIATWLSSSTPRVTPALQYKMNETLRPVKLDKFVYGYFQPQTQTDYLFEKTLSYKVADIIDKHSNSKPTLIFSTTRKSVQQSAQVLAYNKFYIKSFEHKQILKEASVNLKDIKLIELVKKGIGY